jgi:hypothetical protein
VKNVGKMKNVVEIAKLENNSSVGEKV